MGEIVNLRSVKKRVLRAKHAAEAKENRIRHGRTGSEKANDQRSETQRVTHLDALRRSEAVARSDALRRGETGE
jgi:hypothetical protein